MCSGGLPHITSMVPFNVMVLKPNKIIQDFWPKKTPPRVSKFLEIGNNSSMNTLFKCKPAPHPFSKGFHYWALKLPATIHLPCTPWPDTRWLGAAWLPWNPVKLFKEANPTPAYHASPTLPAETTVKALSPVPPSLCLCPTLTPLHVHPTWCSRSRSSEIWEYKKSFFWDSHLLISILR